MREIKFRQPIFLKDKFVEWHYWGFIKGGFVAPATGHKDMNEAQRESQQFIERYDKNGKEVYESDIVKDENDEIYEIIFDLHNADYCLRRKPSLKKEHDFPTREDGYIYYGYQFVNSRKQKDGIEIIGNIWEHSHLLDKTNM